MCQDTSLCDKQKASQGHEIGHVGIIPIPPDPELRFDAVPPPRALADAVLPTFEVLVRNDIGFWALVAAPEPAFFGLKRREPVLLFLLGPRLALGLLVFSGLDLAVGRECGVCFACESGRDCTWGTMGASQLTCGRLNGGQREPTLTVEWLNSIGVSEMRARHLLIKVDLAL